MGYLETSNIIIHLEAKTKEEALKIIIDKMYKGGYVKKEYLADVLEREKNYPTGLPTDGIKVAIPHASRENVIKGCIGIGILNRSVEFKNIVDDEDILDVEIIFVLANEDDDIQVSIISNLMDLLSQSNKLEEIKSCKNPKELIELLEKDLVENK